MPFLTLQAKLTQVDPAWAWEGQLWLWNGVWSEQLPVQQSQLQGPLLEHTPPGYAYLVMTCLVRDSAKTASECWDCQHQLAFNHLMIGIVTVYCMFFSINKYTFFYGNYLFHHIYIYTALHKIYFALHTAWFLRLFDEYSDNTLHKAINVNC